MHSLRSVSAASLATVFRRLSTRRKSTGGRPSAPLGSRILTNPDDIFKHNMWDHVQWTEEDKENARQKAQENSSVHIPLNEQGKFDTEADRYWDEFYETHQNKFFKDRKWLFLEFPELLPPDRKSQETTKRQVDQQTEILLPSGSSIIQHLEIGHHPHSDARPHHRHTSDYQACLGGSLEQNEEVIQISSFPGQHASFRILENYQQDVFSYDRLDVGLVTVFFPIVNSIKETDAFLYCCDFSSRAVQMVKTHPDYDDSVCHSFVHDVREETASFPFPPQSLDVILAVFVLSSIHPERLQGVVNRLSSYLKHGGIFLFRDYGRYDLSQLRFKKGRCLSENFYTRGDGTCVYFFTKEEIHDLFSNAGLEELQNLEDRRLKVNRGKKVAMHRVWMQSKYRKPPPSS